MNNELISRALTMPCVECGQRDHEYVILDKVKTIGEKQITIPNVPTLRCKHCLALAYTPDAIGYMEQHIDHMSH